MAKETYEVKPIVEIPYDIRSLFFDTALHCFNGNIGKIDMNYTRDNLSITIRYPAEDASKVIIEFSASK